MEETDDVVLDQVKKNDRDGYSKATERQESCTIRLHIIRKDTGSEEETKLCECHHLLSSHSQLSQDPTLPIFWTIFVSIDDESALPHLRLDRGQDDCGGVG